MISFFFFAFFGSKEGKSTTTDNSHSVCDAHPITSSTSVLAAAARRKAVDHSACAGTQTKQ
jgi:hypothetical protein